MTTPSNEQSLEGLIERMNAATEYDAELEAAIWLAVVPGASRRNVMANFAGEDPIWEYHDPERNTCARFIPSIMRSIDAALALVERVMPGTYIEISGPRKYLNIPTPVPARWRAELIPGPMPGWADTAPLAILLALLSSLKEHSNDHE